MDKLPNHIHKIDYHGTLLVVLFILYNSLLGSSITQIEVHPQTLTIMRAHNDSLALSAINAQFIQNFVTQNVKAHDQIIDPDFVCIDGSGRIVNRETYLKNWATTTTAVAVLPLPMESNVSVFLAILLWSGQKRLLSEWSMG